MKSTQILPIFCFFLLGLSVNPAFSQLTMKTGTYIGNGFNDRLISGLGFRPDMVIIKMKDGSNETQIRLSSMPDGYSKQMVGSSVMYLDRIKSFDDDGFYIGVNTDVNSVGKTYWYMAFQSNDVFNVGSYIGDGSITGQQIGGIGFQPDLVYLIPANDQRVSFKTSTMVSPAANASSFGGDFTTENTILSLDEDGFTAGNSTRANKLDVEYYYAAFKANQFSLKCGFYIGNGINNHSIDTVGMKADYLFIKGTNSAYACQYSSAMTNGQSVEFASSSTDDNRIHDVNNSGFLLGTQSQVNSNNVVYHYVVFKTYIPPPPSYCMATGSYTGDGTVGREIPDVGFKPAVVIVKAGDLGNEAQIRTNTMIDGLSKPMIGTSSVYTNRINAFTDNGFVIGNNSDVNSSGKTYYWTAFDATPLVYTGTYVGNGVSGRNVTGLPFQPGLVIVIPSGGQGVHWRSKTFPTTSCSNFSSSMSVTAAILNITADGFTIGNSTKVNANGQQYHFVAFKEYSDFLSLGSYYGNGVTGRFIDVPGMAIQYMWVKSSKSSVAIQKSDMMDPDVTVEFTGSKQDIGRINYMGTDGFEVTNSTYVNAIGAMYHYVAFQTCWNMGQGLWWRNAPSSSGANSPQIAENIVKPVSPQAANYEELSVFPNPARARFTMKANSVKNENATVMLIDLSGKVISSLKVNMATGVNNFSINVSGLSSGMYIVRMVKEGGAVKTARVMVNNN